MIEAWKANPDLARRRLIDNLVGKPPAYLADRGEKASFFLSIFLGLAAGECEKHLRQIWRWRNTSD